MSVANDILAPAPPKTRTLILLARGRHEDEGEWLRSQDQPCPEFVALARAMSGQIGSHTSFRAQRGRLFRAIFDRFPLVGSAIGAFLARRRYDVICCVNEETALLAAPLLRVSRWKGRLITAVHTIGPKKRLWLRLVGHTGINKFFVVCTLHADLLTRACKVPEEKVEFHPYWVDTDFFKPGQHAQANCGSYIFSCGKESRDYDLLIAAARDVPHRFVVLGHGYFGDHVPGAKLVSENVEFRPRASYPELVTAYQQADLVVVPVKDVEYAAGLTGLLEAMACGKCAVVTGSRGLEAYLLQHNPGAIVPPGDPAALAAAIRELLSDKARRDAAGRANRAWVEANATVHHYARRAAQAGHVR